MIIFIFYFLIKSIELKEDCTTSGLIAITFDDGPIAYTNEILNIAQQNDVPLTFHFTIHQKSKGDVSGIYKRAVEDGHTVGLRVNPKRDYNDMIYEDIEDDIRRQVDALNKTSDSKIKYARVPVDDGNVNEDVYEILKSNEIIQSSYAFRPYEYDDPIEEYKQLLETSNPKYDSFIIVLHDSLQEDNQYLEKMISIGRENGYTFTNLDECLGGYNPEDAGNESSNKKSKLSDAGVQDIFILPIFSLIFHIL